MKNYFYVAPTGDGWRNLAIDEHLLNTLQPGQLCLLLYINNNAVILGKNQNPWAECNLEKLEADSVQLVRRCSGGGAVYHDNGNLNYSFIAAEGRYDEERQTSLILHTLERFGINAQSSGRNDLTVDGKKVSGTAFCTRGKNRQQHGTLLIDADLTKLGSYLTVAPQKLEAKGIRSVRSRVCNLIEKNPSISVDAVARTLQEEFRREYADFEKYMPDEQAQRGIEVLYERNRSWAWTLGKAPAFDYTLEDRFDFGMARLCLNVQNGLIQEVKLYTDALDPELPERVEAQLSGKRFDPLAIQEVLESITIEL